MDNNNNNWRGRGRGGGGGGNRNYDNDYNNSSYDRTNNYSDAGSNISITSRLGPTHNERTVHGSNYNDNRNNRSNDDQERGGKAFSSNNYRGRGGRGRGRGNGNARFAREFIEEDIDMKPETASNIVTIAGYPPGSEEKVLSFLARKSKSAWEPLNVNYETKSMHITVIDEQTADGLCRMNNFSFGNAVVKERNNSNNNTSSAKNNNNSNNSNNRGGGSSYLVEFLTERFNVEAGFLDMDDLPPSAHNIGLVISRLLTEAKNLFGDSIKTISFARLKLWSVAPLSKVPELFPNLLNLSIAENDIAEFRSLDKLANKLNNLQELLLTGNAIQTNNNVETYQREVLKRFPTIKYLDGQPVNGTGGVAVNEFPVPIRHNFFDQDSSSMAVMDLLSKFFPLFDTNRAGLVDLYDSQAIFSVVFSNGTYQQQNVWGSNQVSPAQRMVFGNENIVKRLLSLPATVHDLSRADNFVTDAWQTTGSQAYPVVLFLNVHGEFVETLAGTPLSFDRTFLVAPSAPGSRAQSSGWSYVILSDSFIVRNYSCKAGSLITAA
ncbi:hypothetical protein BDF21DRAFT_338291 [Thamnidium elegans]|nr:hypothetical protein BDF21DRAFT_338291 [Thamnidium elegans]